MSCLEYLVSWDGDYRDGDYRDGDYRDGDYRDGDYRDGDCWDGDCWDGDYRDGDWRWGHHVDHERCGHPRRLLGLGPVGEHGIGQRDRHDDGDAQRHRDAQRRLDHLLLLLWHIDLVRLVDLLDERRLWYEPGERVGGGDGTQPQHDLPLRARRDELGRDDRGRQRVL
jgi:hypothetical protein